MSYNLGFFLSIASIAVSTIQKDDVTVVCGEIHSNTYYYDVHKMLSTVIA